MIKLTDWNAKRSGAAISISAKDPAGNPCKVIVTNIASDKGKAVAVDKDGARYELA